MIRKLYLISTIVLIAAVVGLCVGLHKMGPSSRSFPFKVVTRLPDSGQYWTLYWAGGLVAQGSCNTARSSQYLFFDNNGYITSVNKALPETTNTSSYCEGRLTFSRLDEPKPAYLGMVDLVTGKVHKIVPEDRAVFIERVGFDPGCFWSPDFNRVLAWKRESGQVLSNVLLIFDKNSDSIKTWKAPSGAVISTAWPEDSPMAPLALTVRPGALYRVDINAESKRIKRLPAFDTSKRGMLSPKGDRAIGSGLGRLWSELPKHKNGHWEDYFHPSGVFYTDFKHPDQKQPLMTIDGRDVSKLMVQSAMWSPDGKQIALLAYDKSDKSPMLYAGDPAYPLFPLKSSKRYRFVGYDDDGLDFSQLAWNKDGTYLFAIMIDRLASLKGELQYVIVRIDCG